METNYIQQINKLILNTKFKNNFIKSIMLILEPTFRLFDSKVQLEFLYYLKKRLKENLMELNLYLDFDNKLKLKKNDIYVDLNSQDLNIEEYTKQYISYYFNINIIIINQITKKHRCVIDYNPKWFSIVLINEKNNYIPLLIDKLLTNEETQTILEEFKIDELFIFRNETDITIEEKQKIAKLNKLKINELKDIAMEYNIDIYKISTSNIKNKFKTKIELTEDIKNYIIQQN
tara:strand:+ start:308 stop:1003 length:696 start_codon:yes stop_codon:yes gene_type:complete